MKYYRLMSFLIITLLLAACAKTTPTSPVVTENPTVPPTQPTSPSPTSPSVSYPAPTAVVAVPTVAAYPEPAQSGSGSSTIPASGYEPQPGDEKLKRDEINLEMTDSKLVITAAEPIQVKAVLTGTMPDPCHSLRVQVTPPDAKNVINIDAYSVVDPNTACIAKIESFTASIPLGSYNAGEYTVNVNGEKLGTFQTAYAPQPGDDKLSRGEATVDMQASRVTPSTSRQGSVNANLKGTLPDPCHKLRIIETPADPQGKINLEVYSVFDPKTACITVIQPFEVIYPLGIFTSGNYSVYVNGELLGEFDF